MIFVSLIYKQKIASASEMIKKLFGLRNHEETNIKQQAWRILASITTPQIWLEFINKNPEYVEKILEAATNDPEEVIVYLETF